MNEKISNYITILSTTHFTNNIVQYSHLSPPSTKLYDRTLTSAIEKFPKLKNCKKVLVYDQSNDVSGEEAEYENNLKEYCDNNDVLFLLNNGSGLRRAVKTGLEEVSTPYVFFLEHDWEILVDEELENVLREFESNPDINYLRFNKRPNIEKETDKILQPGEGSHIPLTKTSSYSNNPHICRTDIYKDWIEIAELNVSSLFSAPLSRFRTLFWLFREIKIKRNMSADAVEHLLSCYYEKKIKKHGFESAHLEMGIYLYGRIGEGPFVKHIGE